MKKQFRITCTHNPQDFFNGVEPAELARAYNTDQLEDDVSRELEQGYQVIVTKGANLIEAENKQASDSIQPSTGTL